MKYTQVSSNKEFLETLEEMVEPPRQAEPGESPAGRPNELKTFILESDKGFPSHAVLGDVSYDVVSTGMDAMKIINARDGETACEFFLDVSDRRFFMLHTNYSSDSVRKIIDAMVGDRNHTLDNTWFHRNMLERIVGMDGNRLQGLGLAYSNLMQDLDERDDIDLRISGSLATPLKKIMQGNESLSRANAYRYVRIMRGAGRPMEQRAYDDVHNHGYFALRRGGSVQDHLHVVDQCREEYSRILNGVEKERINCRWSGGVGDLEGNPFEFIFPNKVKDLDMFAAKVFSATTPFQLWGLRQKMDDGRIKVLAVDLHAGSPVDFEIGHAMMRVCLFGQSCGNIILRLLTNLQVYFDADTYCPMVEEIAE